MGKDKIYLLIVYVIGGWYIFLLDCDVDDYVYCMFEFFGLGYECDFKVGYCDEVMWVGDWYSLVLLWEDDKNKKIVVIYLLINGNGYGGYGEIVMGIKGMLVFEKEKEIMFYKKVFILIKVGIKKDLVGVFILDIIVSGDVGFVKVVEIGLVSCGYKE